MNVFSFQVPALQEGDHNLTCRKARHPLVYQKCFGRRYGFTNRSLTATFKKPAIDSLLSQNFKIRFLQSGMLFGDTQFNQMKKSFTALGIVHLFSVSGLHVHFVSGVLLMLINLFSGLAKIIFYHEKIWKFLSASYTREVILVSLVLYYSFLCGWRPPAIRSSIILIVTCLPWISRGIEFRKKFLIAILFHITLYPDSIFKVGFAVSWSIYLMVCSNLTNASTLKEKVKRLIVLQLKIFLVTSYWFSNVGYFSIFANILFVPLFPYIFLTLVFSFFRFLDWFSVPILEAFIYAVETFSKFAVSANNLNIPNEINGIWELRSINLFVMVYILLSSWRNMAKENERPRKEGAYD